MAAADKADLGGFVSLCVKAKEWERLAQRTHSAKPVELEALSHYCTEPAARGLAKHDALAAAKLYRVLGLRIVNAGKSKYYREALEHFEKARNLYCGMGRASEWEALVQAVQRAHSRKSGFLIGLQADCLRKVAAVPLIRRTSAGPMEAADFLIISKEHKWQFATRFRTGAFGCPVCWS